MLKWLVPPVVVFAYLAATVSASAPRDRDHDRLPDRWERRHQLSTSKPSARRDPDRDRLRNRREYRLRTHPRRKDTDRDRLRDGAEVRRYHTNPRKRDTDGDGYSDRCELRKRTNPRKRRESSQAQVLRAHNRRRQGTWLPRRLGDSPQPTGRFAGCAQYGRAPWHDAHTLGRITVTTPGTVINALDVRAEGEEPAVSVNAPNVVIRNTRVQGNTIALVQVNSRGVVADRGQRATQPARARSDRTVTTGSPQGPTPPGGWRSRAARTARRCSGGTPRFRTRGSTISTPWVRATCSERVSRTRTASSSTAAAANVGSCTTTSTRYLRARWRHRRDHREHGG